MPVDITPTDKPSTETSAGSPVPEYLMPNDDGDIIKGDANGVSYVTIRDGPSLPVDFEDASQDEPYPLKRSGQIIIDPTPRPSVKELLLDDVEDILNDAANDCTEALSQGGILNKLKKKISNSNNVNIVSVLQDGANVASNYVSDAKKNETLGAYFQRRFNASGNRDIYNYSRSGSKAIISMEGVFTFVSGLDYSVPTGFFLHELTHYATGLNDALLLRKLGLKSVQGQTDSQTISNYFNKGCPTSMLKPPKPKVKTKRRGKK